MQARIQPSLSPEIEGKSEEMGEKTVCLETEAK